MSSNPNTTGCCTFFWSDEASEQVLGALLWLWVQNAEAAKDPLSDLISYNLLLAHRHFLVSRIIIMITDSDVPRHDRFHSCHSCGYPPRRCLFSKHITSLNIGGGRDGGGWVGGIPPSNAGVQNFSSTLFFCSTHLWNTRGRVQWTRCV